MSHYEGRGSGQESRGNAWTVTSNDQQDDPSMDVGRKYGSGEEDAEEGGGREGDYVVMARDRSRGSKSASNSPRGGDTEKTDELMRGAEGRGSGRLGEDQRYDNQRKSRSRRKWETRDQVDDTNRESDKDQPVSDVIRKGFGPLIHSDPGGSSGSGDMPGGMELLRDSPGYHLGLSLYDSMKDDSDSERSG